MKSSSRHFIYAVATLVGMIVGAGIFGLPYVALKSGFLVTVFYLVFFGALMLLMHLVFGEIVLRTREKHRLPGYTKMYLGSKTTAFAVIIDTVGKFGAMLIYILLGGQFLALVFGNLLNIPVGGYVAIFWVIFSIGVIMGLKTVERSELWLDVLLVLALAFIAFVSFPKMQLLNLGGGGLQHFFFPYGIVLFSYAGLAAVPEIRDILKLETFSLKKVINFGVIISGVLFLIFTAVILGVSGAETTEDALSGLRQFLGPKIVLPVAIFGITSLASSFLALGIYLKDLFRLDLGFKRKRAGLIVVAIPFLAYILGFTNFIELLGFVGAVTGGLGSILILLVYRAAQKKGDREPEYKLALSPFLIYTIAIIFGAGTIYYLTTFF